MKELVISATYEGKRHDLLKWQIDIPPKIKKQFLEALRDTIRENLEELKNLAEFKRMGKEGDN
jgi:hypothetical protein